MALPDLQRYPFSDQVWIRISYFCFFKLFIFIWVFFVKVTCSFLVLWNNETKKIPEISQANDKGFKDSVVNLTLSPWHGGSLLISRTVPFRKIKTCWNVHLKIMHCIKATLNFSVIHDLQVELVMTKKL